MEEKTKKFILTEHQIHMIKFFLFSVSAGVIQFVSFTLLTEIGKLVYDPAYFIALVLSVLWNFTLNRKFTFKSAANVPIAMTIVAIYYAIFTPLSLWWGHYFTVDLQWNYYLVLIPTMIINMVTEFIVQKYIVYHNQINTALKQTKIEE
ncbi:MAG: GtrA family protein [Candidatus Izemoplasmatales bacterium]